MNSILVRKTLQPRGPAAAVVLSDAEVAELGGGKTCAVQVLVNGRTFAGRIARMGGENVLGFSKQIRAQVCVAAGDALELEITLETSPRIIDLPVPLVEALAKDPVADAAFQALAPSHRKEFARWVSEAKRDETRDRRVAEALTMIRAGRNRR